MVEYLSLPWRWTVDNYWGARYRINQIYIVHLYVFSDVLLLFLKHDVSVQRFLTPEMKWKLIRAWVIDLFHELMRFIEPRRAARSEKCAWKSCFSYKKWIQKLKKIGEMSKFWLKTLYWEGPKKTFIEISKSPAAGGGTNAIRRINCICPNRAHTLLHAFVASLPVTASRFEFVSVTQSSVKNSAAGGFFWNLHSVFSNPNLFFGR